MDRPLFSQDGSKSQNRENSNIPPSGYLPTISPGILLADPKRQELIQKIKELNSGVLTQDNEMRFASLIQPLLDTLCQYYQRLPESENKHYANLAGLLDHALNR